MCPSRSHWLLWIVPARSLLWGRRMAGQVRRLLVQLHLFIKKIVLNFLLPALSHNKCSQFYFSKPIPSILVQAMLVLILCLSLSQAFTLSVNENKTNLHLFPPFCPPAPGGHLVKHFTCNTNSGVTSNILLHLGSNLSVFWLWAKLGRKSIIPLSNCRCL